ncbi:MAG: tagaturonate epimerase family protein [Verrucomicrobiota bacterium]
MNQNIIRIGKYSLGMGDRFAQEAEAQLRACVLAAEQGVEIIPVWNKSNREHMIIGSEPASVRSAAEEAIRTLDWKKEWHVDADHIRLETVDRFMATSDFFTIDVADSIGKAANPSDVKSFCDKHHELIGRVEIPGIEGVVNITRDVVEGVANKFLVAVQEAGAIYFHIEQAKGKGSFIPEVSMDETDSPQTPAELLIILAALADEGIPIQTIAPKFTGRFNKGVDYVGDTVQFEKEFNDDLSVIRFAIQSYGLPENLKLSVHSGSDKFSIYPAIRRAIRKHNAGLHLKTAGTTWLEEIIGLAEAGGEGLVLAKEIYAEALEHREELCAPYATVIDIDQSKLPTSTVVSAWTSEQYVNALRHEPTCVNYNPHLRQLLHVGFKIAAKKGPRYLELIRANHVVVAKNVTGNLFERHIKPIFC